MFILCTKIRMKKFLLLALIPLFAFKSLNNPSFKEKQMEYSRVFKAFQEKWGSAKGKLRAAGINPHNYDIFIRAFKFEEDLEVWAKNKEDLDYTLITSYKFCNYVGELGPKRKEGDMQIPEGVYYMNRFNPTSNYLLSLKVSYPNKSDSLLGYTEKLGGQIYIHGGCNTVGCIPITDDKIKELYVYCVQAKHVGQEQIPIHIFPARLTDENFSFISKQFSDYKLKSFWAQLQRCYKLFENSHRIPRTIIDNTGRYYFISQ